MTSVNDAIRAAIERAARIAAEAKRRAEERERLEAAAAAERAEAAEAAASAYEATSANYTAVGGPDGTTPTTPAPDPAVALEEFHDKIAELEEHPTPERLIEASREFRETLEATPPEHRAALVEAAQDDLLVMAESYAEARQEIGDFDLDITDPFGHSDEPDLKGEYVENLNVVAALLEPEDAHLVTDPLAQAIENGSFETPEDGASGFGPLQEVFDTIRSTNADNLHLALGESLEGTSRASLVEALDNGGAVIDALPPEEQAEVARLEELEAAEERVEDAINSGDPIAASAVLADELERLPAESRGELVTNLSRELEDLTEDITALDANGTATAIANLGRATQAAGPLNAQGITDPIAQAIADGRLEQQGEDADGGFSLPGTDINVAEGANTHNSEREFVDGVSANAGTDGGSLFQLSLAASLEAKGATGIAGAVASGQSQDIPDGNIFAEASQLDDHAVQALDDVTERLAELQAGALNTVLDETLNVSESITDENLQPGDSVSFNAAISGAYVVALGLEGDITVERNDDGTYTVSGGGEFDIGAGIGEFATATGGVGGRIEYTFDNAEDAQRGALALLRQGSEGAVTGALEQLQGPDIEFLREHVSAVELNADAAVSLDARYGLSGVLGGGAEGNIELQTAGRIEFENGEPVAVVHSVEVSAEGAAEASSPLFGFAANGVEDATGIDLGEFSNGGTLTADVSTTVEFRTPISPDGASVTDVLGNPAAYLSDDETVVTVKSEADFQADSEGFHYETEYTGLSIEEGRNLLGGVVNGDLGEAVDGLTLEGTASWNTYEEVQSGGTLDIVVGSGTAEKVTRHNDEETEANISVMGFEDRLEFQLSVDGQPRDPYVWNFA